MLNLKYMRWARLQAAFTLPTVVIASVVLLTVLVAAIGATTSSRTSLSMQYYEALAKDAAESGVAMAESCLYNNGYNAQWSDASKLRTGTNCRGQVNGTLAYVVQGDGFRTTFEVGGVTTGFSGGREFTSTGKTELLRKSNNTVWRTIKSTVGYRAGFTAQPQISGGMGWRDGGHSGFFVSTDGQLYGYGDNAAGTIVDAVPTTAIVPISTPVKIVLPSGVTSVKRVSSSGQGAFFVCIIGNNDSMYCRGESGSVDLNGAWNKFNLSAYGADMRVTDMALNAYGKDNICAIANNRGVNDAQAYCVGTNEYGRLGNGNTSTMTGNVFVPMSSPTRFILPAGQTAVKVFSQGVNTCVIASGGSAFCSGRSDSGQIAGTVTPFARDANNVIINGTGGTATPRQYLIPALSPWMPGNATVWRFPKDIVIPYHGLEESIHVLATDGSLWSSGLNKYGHFGDGSPKTFETRSGNPVWFGAKGDRVSMLSNGGLCIDVVNGSNANGVRIQLEGCGSLFAAQSWFFAEGSQAIYNPNFQRCLDVYGGNLVAGAAVGIYDCNGTGAQRWTWDPATYQIKNVPSGLCMDVINGVVARTSQFQLQTCSTWANPAQRFQPWALAMPVKAVLVGSNALCAVNGQSWGGGMYCSGANFAGQLMNDGRAVGGGLYGAPCTETLSHNFVGLPPGEVVSTDVSFEWQHHFESMQVITKSGKVFGSGSNIFGNLGGGTTGWQCSVTQFPLPPGVTAVDMSTRDEYTTYVLGSDGMVYASGRGDMGQLGNGTTANSAVPVPLKLPRAQTTY